MESNLFFNKVFPTLVSYSMGFALNCWDRISRSGTSGLHSGSEVKRLKLTNRLAIIALIFTLPLVTGFLYYDYTNVALFLGLCCLMYVFVPFISGLKFPGLAKFVLYLTPLAKNFVLASAFGKEADIHLGYIAVILVPFVLYDRRHIVWIISCALLTLSAMLLLYVTDFSLLTVNAPSQVVSFLSITYHIITMGGVIAMLTTSLYLAEKTEKILDADNLFLQSQLKAIFDNSYDAIFLVDSEKRKIIKVNKRAAELFEMKEKELIGRYGLDLHKVPYTEKELQEIRFSLANTGAYYSEVLYKTGKGNEFWGSLAIKQITLHAKKYQVVRIADNSVQHEINDKLKTSVYEKEILLAEVHHRVKNNMAVISGLLGIQSTYVKDEQARGLFEESRNRIHSMALIHDKLYQHKSFAKIDFCAYINDLVSYIKDSYDPGTTTIAVNSTCNDIFLDIKYAVPCGLILNELISNAYKHAFNGREDGSIKIVCTKMGERFTMMVSDDGIGYDMETALQQPNSLGLTLINGLVEQVGGSVKTTSHLGTSFYISFEV